MTVRAASVSDIKGIAALASGLWPDLERTDFEEELAGLLMDSSSAIFVCDQGEALVGFVQLSTRRDYVEGSESSPVGYVEGIFVVPAFRNMGIGRKLLEAAVQWCRSKGYRELGSDVEVHNEDSQKFHTRTSFVEVGRTVNYIRRLDY